MAFISRRLECPTRQQQNPDKAEGMKNSLRGRISLLFGLMEQYKVWYSECGDDV